MRANSLLASPAGPRVLTGGFRAMGAAKCFNFLRFLLLLSPLAFKNQTQAEGVRP